MRSVERGHMGKSAFAVFGQNQVENVLADDFFRRFTKEGAVIAVDKSERKIGTVAADQFGLILNHAAVKLLGGAKFVFDAGIPA